MADTLAKRVLGIIREYSLEKERVKPGQIVWSAVDINERPGRGKNMAMLRLGRNVPTTVGTPQLTLARTRFFPETSTPVTL